MSRMLSHRTKRTRASATGRMLTAALAVAASVAMGIAAGGGTYAAWSVTAPAVAATTLRAGTAELSITGVQLTATGLYPGRTVHSAGVVRNTGTTPLSLSLTLSPTAASTAFTSALVATVGTAGTAADCTAGRVAPVASAAVGAPVETGITLAPGASTAVCVGLGLPANAPAAAAGAAASALTLTFAGSQVAS